MGTRFTSLEHSNQMHETPTSNEKATSQSKAAFWKKGTGSSKVPGRFGILIDYISRYLHLIETPLDA